MTVDRDTVLYLAGHFDAEGCIHFPKSAYGVVHITVGHTHYDTLLLYKQCFGGEIYTRDMRKVPTHHKQVWQWRLGSKIDCARFLLQIEPHLREKNSRAQVALARLLHSLQK